MGREREPDVSLVRREREIMTKKYELTQNTFTVAMEDLYQIKALQDFGDVKAGDLGGYIKSEKNLSQKGDCWVYPGSFAYEDASVTGSSKIMNGAHVCGNAEIDDSIIKDVGTLVCDYSKVIRSTVKGGAWIHHDVEVYDSVISNENDNTELSGNTTVVGANISDATDIIYVNIGHTTFYRSTNKIRVSSRLLNVTNMPIDMFEEDFKDRKDIATCVQVARTILNEKKNRD